jgi:hypothetical protein
MLQFLEQFFAFDIKASLITGNPSFHKSLKYLKTEVISSGCLPFLDPEKEFLFATHENSFVFILR